MLIQGRIHRSLNQEMGDEDEPHGQEVHVDHQQVCQGQQQHPHTLEKEGGSFPYQSIKLVGTDACADLSGGETHLGNVGTGPRHSLQNVN